MPNHPPLLLLHAFAASGRSWDGVRAALPGWTTASPTLPGFGDTAAPAAPSLEGYVEAIRQTVMAQRLERPVLVGWSMSGKLALRLAAEPDLIAGLVLVAPSPPSPEPIPNRDAQVAAFSDPAAAADAIDAITARRLPEPLRAAAIADRLAVDPAVWRWWWKEGSCADLGLAPGAIRTPALLLAGAADPNLGPAVQRRLTAPVLADVQQQTIPDCGHLVPLEQPAPLAAAFAAWAQRL